MSVAGGLPFAIARAQLHRCETLQIFSKNASQWRARPLPPEEIAAFRAAATKTGISPIVAHASYLINLATTSEALRAQSIAALGEEVDRAEVARPARRRASSRRPTDGADRAGALPHLERAHGSAESTAARKDDDPAGAHSRPGQHDGRLVRGDRSDARRREERERASACAWTRVICSRPATTCVPRKATARRSTDSKRLSDSIGSRCFT